MNKHIIDWLTAILLPDIGPITLRRAIDHLGDIQALFNASKYELSQCGLTRKQIAALQKPNWREAERCLAWCQTHNCHILTWESPDYPPLLKEIPDPPPVLFVRGKVDLLKKPQIAMVGSRNPTPQGAVLAKQFAYCLAKAGFIITSGFALGIDAASHRGSLAANGETLAVLGTGCNVIYPQTHHALATDIIENGALVSEFLPDTAPKAQHFPRRNRIISGLSLGVLVVEAALRSGSLITARCSIEQGRDVFAIPGSIQNPQARGCHQLIRMGAKLVETAEDILEELGALQAAISNQKDEYATQLSPLPDKSVELLQQIGYEVTALDLIMQRSGLTASEVSSMLLSLELTGHVQNVPGGYLRTTMPI